MSGKSIEQSVVSLLSFKTYLLGNRRNRVILWISCACIVIQFSVFKYFYPYASYIHGDSFMYLSIAERNADIESYMVGYGRFLRLFSVFSNLDIALVFFQYLMIQASALFFLFTLFYFYRPGKAVRVILLGFMILNPLFLHLANLVSSDGFFLALSFIWFTLLLWIVQRPTVRLLVVHALVLFLLFTVRYNALIYPFIALLAFALARLPLQKKIGGATAGFLLIGLFVFYTGSKYKALTGTWQYSPFSGWALANNAMYAYRFVDSADRKPVPKHLQPLDNMIRSYFDSTRDVRRFPVEAQLASTVYMWSPNLPLYSYRDKQFAKDTMAVELKKWASMGPLYADYGKHIILQYPWFYARYYIWYNAQKYYAPPVEFLATYNSGQDSVAPVAQRWFKYKSRQLTTRTKDLNVYMLDFYPILAGVMNVVFLCGIVCFLIIARFKADGGFGRVVLLVGVFWLLNAGFSIFATSAALRFLAFPVLLMFSFACLFIDWLWRSGLNASAKDNECDAVDRRRVLTGVRPPAAIAGEREP